jgi:protein-disulfide isomerase
MTSRLAENSPRTADRPAVPYARVTRIARRAAIRVRATRPIPTSGADDDAMSRANRIGKELARQRAAVAKIEAEYRSARNRRVAVYGSSFGVVLLAVVLAIVVNQAMVPSAPPLAPTAAVSDTTGGVASADAMAIPIGEASAPVKLTVYEDFRCSACDAYEKSYQSAYKALVKADKVELLIHPVDLIDNVDGGSGSIEAGNAAACAQNAGKFEDYHDILYADQPAETDDAFASTATLISYAKQVSGLDTASFESCVKSGKYDSWVKQNYRDLEQIDGNSTATPTLLANGTKLTLSTPAAFTTQLTQLAAKAEAAASASASSTAKATSSASSAASASPSASASGSTAPIPSASASQS